MIVSLLVLIGMWLEHYMIITTSLSRDYPAEFPEGFQADHLGHPDLRIVPGRVPLVRPIPAGVVDVGNANFEYSILLVRR